jgi:hypothetical protein
LRDGDFFEIRELFRKDNCSKENFRECYNNITDKINEFLVKYKFPDEYEYSGTYCVLAILNMYYKCYYENKDIMLNINNIIKKYSDECCNMIN